MAQQRNGWLGEGKEALLPPRTQVTGHHLRFSLIRFQLETAKSKDATERRRMSSGSRRLQEPQDQTPR